MNNNFNNQTPPDYSYNWNGNGAGSDNNGNNGNKGKKTPIILAVVFGVLILVAVVFAISQNGFNNLNDSSSQSEGVSIDESAESTESTDSSLEFSRDPDMSVPDFSIIPDNDNENSSLTGLTAIYEKCAPACCTVRVSVRGRVYSIGSGFVIDSEGGYIATNHHVIEDGDQITVVFYNGQEYDAKIVGSDSTTDLAVLHIDAKGLPQVTFGDSNKIKIGEGVVAIGTPFDEALAGTMTSGIVSGIARDIEITNDTGVVTKRMTLIQTDCSINPGNSGGPLIDMSGNVIGINSLKIVDEQYELIGFAIPITSALDIFEKLIKGEDIGDSDIAVATPKIGITIYDVEDGLSEMGIRPRCEYPKGVIIAEIEIQSAAYAAGLSRYDIITDFNGDKITNQESLANALSKYRAGETVTVTVFRFNRMLTGGEYETITFKLDSAS